jgi:hypothetical protein
MAVRTLFATRLYQALIDEAELLGELAHSIRTLAMDDGAGRRWSRDKGYRGYTSYASLNDLPRRDPAFEDLRKLLVRHAAGFAADLAFDLGRKPKLDSLWVNLLQPGGHHAGHIHPHSILSGTLYVEAPKGGRDPVRGSAPRRYGRAIRARRTGGFAHVRHRRSRTRPVADVGSWLGTRCCRARAKANGSHQLQFCLEARLWAAHIFPFRTTHGL